MTATVPENLQVSLGNGMLSTIGTGDSATTNKLVGTVGANGRLTAMTAPGSDDADTDWTNAVVISDYYTLGHLTPATSTTGANIFYTSDATIVGKTLAAAADFKSATKSGTAYSAALLLKNGASDSTALTDNYSKGGAYYVDIPVWFRTSSETAVNLAVKATISNGVEVVGNRKSGADSYDEDLYKAARVAILKGDGTVATTTNGTSAAGTTEAAGVIYDSTTGDDGFTSGYYRGAAGTTTGAPFQGVAIAATPATTGAHTLNAEGTLDTLTWTPVQKVTEATVSSGTYTAGSGDIVAVVPAADHTTANFGSPARYTIRVWLEGEDVNCWNATAGQDFSIDLRFYNQTAYSDPNT